MADGPALWGKPVRHAGPGVYVVELNDPVAAAPTDLAAIGKWLERVPDLRLDGERPTSRDLQQRLGRWWLPSQPVLLIGSTRRLGRGPGGRDREDRPRQPEARRIGVLAALPAVIRPAPRVVGGDRRAGGVRGRPARCVRRRRAGRGARHAPRSVGRAALGHPPLAVGRAQGHRDHQPAAARGPGTRTAADHPDRRSPSRGGRRGTRRGEAGSSPRAGTRRRAGGRGRRVRGPGIATQGPGADLPVSRRARADRDGARRARRPATRGHQAHRHRTRARRPQGERRVPRRTGGAGVPRGSHPVDRGEAQDRRRRRAHRARRAGRAGRPDPGRGRRRGNPACRW